MKETLPPIQPLRREGHILPAETKHGPVPLPNYHTVCIKGTDAQVNPDNKWEFMKHQARLAGVDLEALDIE